jgi:hypothetical protein
MPTHNDPPKTKEDSILEEGTETRQRRRALTDKKMHLEARLAKLTERPHEEAAESMRSTERDLRSVKESLKALESKESK